MGVVNKTICIDMGRWDSVRFGMFVIGMIAR